MMATAHAAGQQGVAPRSTERSSAAEQRTPVAVAGEIESWLPPSVVAVVRFRAVGELWAAVEQSDLFRSAVGSDTLRRFQASPQYEQFAAGQRLIEGLFGTSLGELYRGAAAGPGLLAVDRSGGVALILTPSAEVIAKTAAVLDESARLAGLSREGRPAVRAVSYRGIPAFALDRARIAVHREQVVLTSDNQLGKAILDRALGDRQARWTETAWYQAAEQALTELAAEAAPVRGAVDLQALRDAGKWNLTRGQDVGQELIGGGVSEVLEQAPWAVLASSQAGERWTLRVAVPFPAELSTNWDYFFGSGTAEHRGAAPEPIAVPGQLASFRWHRDLAAFWNLLPALIRDENAQAGIAKSESDIATLLGGVTTVGDVLGYWEPQMQIVVGPAAAGSSSGEPLRLPTFAVVGKLRQRDDGERVLRLAFQQLVSFANLNAGPGGYPPLEVLTERVDGNTFCRAQYLQMSSGQGRDYATDGLYRNFTPTLAISEQRLVLASDRELAEQLLRAESPAPAAASAGPGVTNTVLQFWPQEIVAWAEQNRGALLAQRMLQTGRSREEVAAELELWFAVARYVSAGTLRLAVERDFLTLEAELRGAEDSPPTPSN